MEDLRVITQLYEQLGGAGVGIIGTFLFLMKNKSARLYILKQLLQNSFKEADVDGQYALIMAQLRYWSSPSNVLFVFKDRGRQAIFQDLVKIKFQVFTERLEYLYREFSRGKILNDSDLHDFLSREYIKISEEIHERQKKMQIPEVQIEKYMIWQRPSFAFTMSQIESISLSKSNGSIEHKLESILNILRQNMSISLQEAERTLRSLNGTLTGQVYKGFVCGPLEH